MSTKPSLRSSHPELFTPHLSADISSPLLDDTRLDKLRKSYHEDYSTHHKTITTQFGEGTLRALLYEQPNATSTIVVHRYFGGGIDNSAHRLAGALHTLAPQANILTLPNDTIPRSDNKEQNNLAFSKREYEQLTEGDPEPYLARTRALLEHTNLDATSLHFVGTSQGALVSRAVAEALRDQNQHDISSITLIEPPTELDERMSISALKLQKSMAHYLTNLESDLIDHELHPAIADTGLFSRKDWQKFNQKPPKADIRPDIIEKSSSLHRFMLERAAINAALGTPTLPGITLYGAQSGISNPSYDLATPEHPVVTLTGDSADHSIAMTPSIVTAAAAHAYAQTRTPKSTAT